MVSLKRKSEAMKEISKDKSFHIVNIILVLFVFVIVFYPLYYIVICSFSSGAAISAGRVVFYPVDITFDGYKEIFSTTLLFTGFKNTFIYTIVGTCINLFMTVIAAYPLSRSDLPFKKFFTFLFAFTMWFSGGLIPTYLWYKDLGLINTMTVMVVPGAIGIWNMIITRTYFSKSIPEEIAEASRIDGCDHFTYLMKIGIPLAKPVLAVITLYYAVGHWNSYFNAMIYINNSALYPLQLVLRDILLAGKLEIAVSATPTAEELLYRENLQQMLKYSVIVVGTVPMLLLYTLVQKYFEKGIMVGSLKG